VIETHPCIAQVVVVGLPDERYGETVNAVVSCPNGMIRSAELTALCRQELANYKVPKSIRVIPAFPLLANGKIDRVGTRAMASELPALD
jgi:fatty-acyl-CoA synthase